MNGEDLSAALRKIDGALYNKIGEYMDKNKADVYYLEKDQTYAVSDRFANRGCITNVQGNISALKYLKFAGKSILFLSIGIDVYNIYTSTNKPRAITSVAGGWTGAWIGGTAGCKAGAAVGSLAGPEGTAFGGIIGGIAGGIGGYFCGSKMTETVYDKIISPGFYPGK